jgi:hypothetical protein
MKLGALIIGFGVVAVVVGATMALAQWHRTLGLGGIGLGVLLVVGGAYVFSRTAGIGRREAAAPQPPKPGIIRRALIAVLVVIVVGAGTFFGAIYFAGSQSGSTTTGFVTTSYYTGFSSSTQVTSSLTQSSTSISGCVQGSGGTSGVSNQLSIVGSGLNYKGNGSSAAVQFTTARPPSLIVVYVTVLDNPRSSETQPPAVSNVSASQSSIAFHRRAAVTTAVVNAGKDKFSEEEWYAVANGTVQNPTIVAKLSSPSPLITVLAFGVAGANTKSPFDPSTTLPATGTGDSASPVGSISVPLCTSNPNDMIIGGAAMSSASPATSYQLIDSDRGQSASQDPIAEYQLVSTTQNNFQVSFTNESPYLAQTWIIIGDAIKAA